MLASKGGRACEPDILGTCSSSSTANLTPITRELPDLLADIPKLGRAFSGANSLVAPGNLPLDPAGTLDPNALASLQSGRNAYASLFPTNAMAENAMTSDQFLKALGFGLNSTNALTAVASGNPLVAGMDAASFAERATLRNENVDLNEICEIISRLSIEDCLNNDEKVLNAAICILFNDIPKALMNPGNVAEEIYSSEFDRQISQLPNSESGTLLIELIKFLVHSLCSI